MNRRRISWALAGAAAVVAGFVVGKSWVMKPTQPSLIVEESEGMHRAAGSNAVGVVQRAKVGGAVEGSNGAFEGLSGDTVERQPQIDKLVEGLTTAERVKKLEEVWTEEATGARRELAGELIRKWAHEMPQAAAEWLAKKPTGALHREASRSVAVIWANQNLSEAANWVRRWPEEEKESGLIAVAYEAVRTSPKEALWLAAELSETSNRDNLIAHAAREWATQDASAPVDWAEKMEKSALRDEVFANTAISLSETDPGAAAKLALEKLSPGARQDNAVASIVQRWAQTEPTAAADWVVRFPEGRLRDTSVENLVQIWADKSPDEAGAWLNQIEDGPVRDAGLAAYARKLAPSEPEAAMKWAETIADERRRNQEVESLVALWMHADRTAAGAWLQTSSLSDEIKGRVLKVP